jgi:hypothetical protein
VHATKRVFSDLNHDVMLMWKELKKGWIPPTKITEEEYAAIRKSPGPSALRGFAGTHCSFGGLFLNTYARSADGTNFAEQGSRVCRRRIRTMARNSYFICADYMRAISLVPQADVIFCDPPYIGTTEYTVGSFNHEEFWENIRKLTTDAKGNKRIMVSEYTAPADFTIVLDLQSRMGLATKAEDGSLQKDLRRELVVEYNPPLMRKRVFFGDLYAKEKQ